jgi:hypothetical protein
MSKACKTREEAEASQKHHADNGEPCHIEEIAGGLFLIRRDSDNKVLKSINYSPADLAQFLA